MAKSDVLVRMKADTQNYDANIAKARRQLDQFKKDNLSMGGAMKQLSGNLVATAARFVSVTAAVGALGAAFKSNIETAKNFEKSMSQLSSLTGMVGDDLSKLKEYAIELGSTTTLSASQVADAFKMIGSQQPQLLESGEALKAVTKNAITLAEAAGIELGDAAKTLSVSINQMGGDSNNAARYINVLAAASQKGAGDIVWLGEAITKSGTTAKAVGTDYEELVANLEQLAKAGYDASTAGTALRSIIMNLEKQANQQYKPSVVGLTEAFKNLGKANLTLTEYQQIAGKMFAAQAKALADAAGEAENMKVQITGTNTAEEQAKTNTDNLDGSLKSLASAWEGLNLHINSSNGLLRDAVDWLKYVVTWADEAYQSLERYYNGPSGPKEDIGGNIDDKGNYIKRPANGNWAGFDAKNGTWKTGYTGAIYNSQTGQTELPEVIVNGNKRAGGSGGGGGGKGGTSTVDKEAEQTARMLAELRKQEAKATKEIADARAREHQTETKGLSGFNEQTVNAWTAMMKDQLSKADFGSVVYNSIEENMRDMTTITDLTKEALKRGLDPQSLGLTELFETAFDNIDVPDSTLKAIVEKINAAMKDGLRLEINSETGKVTEKKAEKKRDTLDDTKKIVGGLSNIASGLQQMGVELPDEVNQIIGVAQGLMTVIEGVNTIIGMTQTPALVANTIAMDALTTALWTTGFFGFAHGGVVPHAAGGFAGTVPGNHFSGDVTPIMANAGEVVLNRAQAGVLANQLEAGGQRGGYTPSHVSGKQIWIALNAYTRRTGKGELVPWR